MKQITRNTKIIFIFTALLLCVIVGVVQAATTLYLMDMNATGVVPNAKQSADTIAHSVNNKVTGEYLPIVGTPASMTTTSGTAAYSAWETGAEPGYAHYGYYGTWVSEPLYAQTISGTVAVSLVMMETDAAVNAYPRVKIYRWKADDTFGSDLLALTNSTTEIAAVTWGNSVEYINTAITSTDVNDGDRIVMELETADNNAASTSVTEQMRLGGYSAAYNNFITFSDDITFYSAQYGNWYFTQPAAVGTIPNAKQSADAIYADIATTNATYAAPSNLSGTAGSTNTETSASNGGSSSLHYTHYGSWVTPPLKAQTVYGTVTSGLVMTEGNTKSNNFPRLKIYQWFANDTIGSDLLALTTSATEADVSFPASPTAYFSKTALASTSIAEGDRIVIELESADTPTATTSYQHGIRFGGASGGGYGSYIRFSDGIVILLASTSAPVAAFTSNVTTGSSPLPVGFTDQSTNTPTAWNWSYTNASATGGNGTELWWAQTQNPSQSFGGGNWSIKLNASNSAGYNITPNLYWINVSSTGVSPPVASFTVNRNMARIPQSITVTDTSTNIPESWEWSWGDGTANSTTQNPTHSYTKRGMFTINMAATNAGGTGVATAQTVRVVGYENLW
jgi:PKD repeat protein